MKILPVGPELFHLDKQRDMTKLLVVVAFHNFAYANSYTICEGGSSFVLSISIGEPIRR
jgi:hypothetical protein